MSFRRAIEGQLAGRYSPPRGRGGFEVTRIELIEGRPE